MIKFIDANHPLQTINPELKSRLIRAQSNLLHLELGSAGELCEKTFADLPADVFFKALALMDQKQPVRHIEPKGALNSKDCAWRTLGVELIDDQVVRNPS